jgi:hypothetical protein
MTKLFIKNSVVYPVHVHHSVRGYGYKHYSTVGTRMYMILSLHLMSCFGNEATANIASFV